MTRRRKQHDQCGGAVLPLAAVWHLRHATQVALNTARDDLRSGGVLVADYPSHAQMTDAWAKLLGGLDALLVSAYAAGDLDPDAYPALGDPGPVGIVS